MNIQPISHLSLFRISGEDAETFLQGQLSSDVANLSNSWQYAGYCNPKGRLLALLQIWRQDEGFYALISQDLLQATIKRLRMYVMRSKVSIEELDDCQLIGLLGRDSSTSLDLAAGDEALERLDLREYQHGDLVQTENLSALIINQRALIVSKINSKYAYQRNLEAGSLWLQADINEGLPQVSAATLEQFIPQMLNLDVLGGISFKKGCYTGQEIVARMHYLGKLKQRMFSCDISEIASTGTINKDIITPEAGNKVYADLALEKAIGTLVSVDHASHRALAVLRLDSLEIPLYLNSNHQIILSPQQAYEFPD